MHTELCHHPGCSICLIQWSHDNHLHCGRRDCRTCYVRFDLNANIFDDKESTT